MSIPDHTRRPAVDLLRALRAGPARAPDLCARLGISQPTLSRAVRAAGPSVLVAGRGRKTHYAARRTIDLVTAPIPVYEVRSTGVPPRRLLALHPVQPDGFWLEWTDLRYVLAESRDPVGGSPGVEFTEDLPWFLAPLRPAGYLGRLLPARYGGPPDVLRWSGDDVLRFATRHGWDQPGALIVGDEAFRAFADAHVDRVHTDARAARYPELARDTAAAGPVGSSAGGERPKFLTTRDDGDRLVPVLVKFSPPTQDPVATRTADLLIAEHVALATIGRTAARTTLLRADDRVFLEVERFDREGVEHRRGVIELGPVDGEFVGGPLDRWTTTTAALVQQGLLTDADHREVRWRAVYGTLIANTDMHSGNLALWLDGVRIAGVAPCYDMLPMAYAPRNGEIVRYDFVPRLPDASDADVAQSAWDAATVFWRAVAGRPDVSAGFRQIAAENVTRLDDAAPALRRLPLS